MKYLLHTIAVLLTASLACGQSPDPSKMPDNLRRLRVNYETAVDRAVSPLKRTYEIELKRLKLEGTRAGSLDAALAVDAGLKALAGVVDESKVEANRSSIFSDTIWRNQAREDVEFKSNGSFSETFGGKLLTGTWEIVTDTEVVVARSDQTTWHFIVLPNRSITRRENRDSVWQQVKKK